MLADLSAPNVAITPIIENIVIIETNKSEIRVFFFKSFLLFSNFK